MASANLVVSAFALLEHHNSLHRYQHNSPLSPFSSQILPPCCIPFKPEPFYFMTVQFLCEPLVRKLVKRVLEISACYISRITLCHMLVDSFKEFKSACESWLSLKAVLTHCNWMRSGSSESSHPFPHSQGKRTVGFCVPLDPKTFCSPQLHSPGTQSNAGPPCCKPNRFSLSDQKLQPRARKQKRSCHIINTPGPCNRKECFWQIKELSHHSLNVFACLPIS